jgi:EAL domain-containing protein (putative c-di-GMP-specific phosphodiesterase class I)
MRLRTQLFLAIETTGELEAIRELGVFGTMGLLIGGPEPGSWPTSKKTYH